VKAPNLKEGRQRLPDDLMEEISRTRIILALIEKDLRAGGEPRTEKERFWLQQLEFAIEICGERWEETRRRYDEAERRLKEIETNLLGKLEGE
jgi:hypothetical protein